MEHRRNVTPDIGIGQLQLGNGSQGVAADIFMGEHHPLGSTGGAAGVIQMGNLVFINSYRLKALGFLADDLLITMAFD